VRSHYLILLTADESLFKLREAHASTKQPGISRTTAANPRHR
jgi:hypothetical protein